MRTKGLVWSLAFTLAFAGRGQAAEEAASAEAVVAEDQAVASEYSDAPEYVGESLVCDPGYDSWYTPDCWGDFLIGTCSCYHLYAGTEFTFLDIQARTGGRTTLSFSDTTAPGVATFASAENNGLDDRGAAPRVWLGAQFTDKWGARARYWELGEADQHAPTPNPAIPNVGTHFATIVQTDTVEASLLDVEGVRNFQLLGFKGDVFVGGRHANFETDADLLAFGVFTTGNFVNLTLQNGIDFEGSGVTYGGTLRRQLGNSHLYAFGTARGSVCEGESTSFGRSDGTVASSPSAPLVGAATVTRAGAEAELYIFEFQAGLEFEWPLRDIPANFFFRTAYEFQDWDLNGKPTGGAGFGGTIGELTTNSFASAGAEGPRLVLHGLSLGTGLTW